MVVTNDIPYFKIREGTIYSTAIGGDIQLLDRVLSLKHPKAKQIKYAMFKKKKEWAAQWDGRVRFLKRPSNKFPSGLLRVLPELLALNDIPRFTLDVTPSTRRVDVPEDFLDLITEDFLEDMTFRPYQLQSIRDLLRENRGVAHCATNSGKTEIIIALIKFITIFLKESIGNSQSIMLVNSLDLLYQAQKRIRKRWPEADVGIVGHGKFEDDKDVVVATGQTLASRLRSKKSGEKKQCTDLLKNTNILLLDECHHTQSESWKDIAYGCHAVFRYGFSGTAFNRKGINGFRNFELMSITGKKLTTVSNKFLIDEGYSARPTIYFEPIGENEKNLSTKILSANPVKRTPCKIFIPDSKDMWVKGIFLKRILNKKDKPTGKALVEYNGSTHEVSSDYLITKCYYDRAIVDYQPRNQAIVDWSKQFKKEKKPNLIIIKKRVHGRLLEQLLLNEGLDVKFVWGKTDPEKRAKARQDLSDGRLDALIATCIFDEGVDAPNIRAMIIAAASKSYDKTLQRVGRGLRRKEEDNTITIVDFVDYQNPHTLKASLARLEDYESEEFTVEDC